MSHYEVRKNGIVISKLLDECVDQLDFKRQTTYNDIDSNDLGRQMAAFTSA